MEKELMLIFLIGILEDIKKELLDQIDTSSQDDEINY